MTLGISIFAGLLVAALGGQTSLHYVFWESELAAGIIGLLIVALSFVAREDNYAGRLAVMLVLGIGSGFWACSAGLQLRYDIHQVFWLNVLLCFVCTVACLAHLQAAIPTIEGGEAE